MSNVACKFSPKWEVEAFQPLASDNWPVWGVKLLKDDKLEFDYENGKSLYFTSFNESYVVYEDSWIVMTPSYGFVFYEHDDDFLKDYNFKDFSVSVNELDFKKLYDAQCVNQSTVLMYGGYGEDEDSTVPRDDIRLFSYHVQQLLSEIGEVLDADKRWKNFRNEKYEPEHKLEEIADCFIVLMNIAIFSGFSASKLYGAIKSKLGVFSKRVSKQYEEKE